MIKPILKFQYLLLVFGILLSSFSEKSFANNHSLLANVAPVSNAGADQVISTPGSIVTLTGAGTDRDGTIKKYAWSQVSGPSTSAFTTSAAAKTTITNLAQGSYTYRLTVTDDSGAVATDDVIVRISMVLQAGLTATVVSGLQYKYYEGTWSKVPDFSSLTPIKTGGTSVFDVSLGNRTTLLAFSFTGYIYLDSDAVYTFYTASDDGSNLYIDNILTVANDSLHSLTEKSGIIGLKKGKHLITVNFFQKTGDNKLTVSYASSTIAKQAIPSSLLFKVNALPKANAGTDITVTLPTTTATLNGAGTDSDGVINSYTWTKLSGPTSGAITTAAAANTGLTALSAGTYKYLLTVKDDNNGIATDTVNVVVSAAAIVANKVPVANAGADQTIVLPSNTATLIGSGTDTDGTIASYTWAKVSGPTAGVITTPTAATTTLTALAAGTYVFSLTVKDNSGASATDNVTVTVKAAAANVLPVANAGADISISLPVTTVTLNGAGTDSDGTISSYAWTKLSGPLGGLVLTPSTSSITVTALIAGTYIYQLTVTDNAGGTAKDTVQVIVNSVSLVDSIIKVAGGEYVCAYITKNGRVFAARYNSSVYVTSDLGLSNIVEGDGAQYTAILRSGTGLVYVYGENNPTVITAYPKDNLGNAFTADKVYGFYQSYIAIKSGKVYFWGNDIIGQNGGAAITAPKLLNQPAGKTIIKIAVSSSTTFNASTTVMALASDGTVWKWTSASTSAQQITFSGKARDITCVGPVAFVIETETDLLGWGFYGSYIGAPNLSTTPTSIKAKWTAAGCVFPTKELVGNYNTLHIVDQNDNMYAAGSNIQGEIGDGKEYNTWKTHAPYVWLWNFTNGDMMVTPKQIPGKYKNLQTSNTIAFYYYVQDMGNNWYSWGRNKSRVLGNGLSLNIFMTRPSDEELYPCALNIPAPRRVNPLTQAWTVVPKFDPNAKPLPLSNAGINQYIATTTTTLYGSGSSQQDGSITGYAWSKISGNGGTIVSPTAMNTNVTGLTDGTYIFRLTVTSNSNVKATNDVTVVVKGAAPAANKAPTANAGTDITASLLNLSVTLNAGASVDTDGTIVSYTWAKLSGPTLGSILTPTGITSLLSSLVAGTYQYQLTVTDDKGATGKDTVNVTISLLANVAPVAKAGNDQVITLPVSTVTLAGAGTDSDGTIASYKWTKSTGTTAGTITNAATASTTVTGLTTAGVYKFTLTVTDNGGSAITDEIQITVNPAAAASPVINSPTLNVNVFGGSNPYANTQWNNWNVVSSLTSNNLTYADGSASTVKAVLTSSGGVTDNGTGYAPTASACPTEVLRYVSLYTLNRTLTIQGLNPAKQYDLSLFASRAYAGQSTIFKIGTLSQTIATNNNVDNFALFENITPAGAGTITINISGASTYNYLSGFTITEVASALARSSTQSGTVTTVAVKSKDTVAAPVAAPKAATEEKAAEVKPVAQLNYELAVYPNPVQTMLTAKTSIYPFNNEQVFLTLTDMQGRVVYKKEIRASQQNSTVQIDMSALKEGMYILNMQSTGKAVSQKVIKQAGR